MKKYFAAIIITLISLSSYAVCPEFNPPSKFKAREELISIGTDIILYDQNMRLGEIEERTIRLTPTFELYNAQGEKVAIARKKIFSWGTTIDITDCEGKLIGTVKENIFKSFFNFYSRYDVLDAHGNIIAATAKTEFFATNFIVYDNNKEEVMKIHRSTLSIVTDFWSVQIFKNGVVDPRIMTMIPAFKTSADNKKREEEEDD